MKSVDKKVNVVSSITQKIKQAIEIDYIEASKDFDRLELIKEWEVLDGEDWNDSIYTNIDNHNF